MKRFILVAIVCWVPLASAVQAEQPANFELAERLMEAMRVEEMTEQSLEMVRQMIPGMMEQMGVQETPASESLQTAALDLVFEEMGWPSLKKDFIGIYAETYSAEELEGLIAFYESPVGRRFVAKQPELMRRTMEVSQGRMVDLMPKLQALFEEKAPDAGGAPDAD